MMRTSVSSIRGGDGVSELIRSMVANIVDTPSAVKVDAVVVEGAVTLYRVQVANSEIGQVIGKQGRTARSLRTILAAVAMKEKRRIELDIVSGR
jgi:uncharacterized protein